jgi:hypothetical protein
LISQEKSSRIAPFQAVLSVVYTKTPNNENPWPSILRMMMDTDFIKSLTVLIHLCVLNHRQDIFYVIEDILREFLNSLDGLIFIANQTSTPSGLLRALYFAVRIYYQIKRRVVSHIKRNRELNLKNALTFEDLNEARLKKSRRRMAAENVGR